MARPAYGPRKAAAVGGLSRFMRNQRQRCERRVNAAERRVVEARTDAIRDGFWPDGETYRVFFDRREFDRRGGEG